MLRTAHRAPLPLASTVRSDCEHPVAGSQRDQGKQQGARQSQSVWLIYGSSVTCFTESKQLPRHNILTVKRGEKPMAMELVNVTALNALNREQLEVTPTAPRSEDPGYLGPASPETVARNIARRARMRVLATLAPLAFLLTLLLIVSGVGL